MSIHIKSTPATPGYTHIADLKYLTFARLIFGDSFRAYSASSGAREIALDVFAGQCTVKTPGGTLTGEARRGPFDDPPVMFYIPPSTDFTVECATGDAHVALFSAPASGVTQAPVCIQPGDATLNRVGKANWFRDVYSSIGENVAAAKLLVGETINPPGNWSSSPPHKHDTFSPPSEVPMEEIYYFQVRPKQGFGFMRLYTNPTAEHPFDQTMLIQDGDTVLIPRGYHTVVAAPGYRINYAWALAGEGRKYGAWADDPNHSWLRNT
jgi:5-deoxy-glucuronate isomerase